MSSLGELLRSGIGLRATMRGCLQSLRIFPFVWWVVVSCVRFAVTDVDGQHPRRRTTSRTQSKNLIIAAMQSQKHPSCTLHHLQPSRCHLLPLLVRKDEASSISLIIHQTWKNFSNDSRHYSASSSRLSGRCIILPRK